MAGQRAVVLSRGCEQRHPHGGSVVPSASSMAGQSHGAQPWGLGSLRSAEPITGHRARGCRCSSCPCKRISWLEGDTVKKQNEAKRGGGPQFKLMVRSSPRGVAPRTIFVFSFHLDDIFFKAVAEQSEL